MAQDCFYTPGGKTYELLEEEETPIFAGPNQLVVDQAKSVKKSKKKVNIIVFNTVAHLIRMIVMCSDAKSEEAQRKVAATLESR